MLSSTTVCCLKQIVYIEYSADTLDLTDFYKGLHCVHYADWLSTATMKSLVKSRYDLWEAS